MPELPEVEALRGFLTERCVGEVIARVDLAAFSALKTVELPLDAFAGLEVEQVRRFGKFIGLEAGGVWLIFHLARAGWLKWKDKLPTTPPKPGRGPLAARVTLAEQNGFELTEAGTQKKLALYAVNDPQQVPGIARLGPDPLADDFTADAFAVILAKAGRSQLKGVLRDQSVLAGVGNAYSDEILHAARLSPFKPANSLDGAGVQALHAALRDTLTEAVEAASGKPAAELKDAKRRGMQVHGRKDEACPVCGDTVAEVSFADSSLQYCPTCQTGGKPLADRRMSRLLK